MGIVEAKYQNRVSWFGSNFYLKFMHPSGGI